MEILAECVRHAVRFSVVVDLVISKSWIVMYRKGLLVVEIVFKECFQIEKRVDERARRANLENSHVIREGNYNRSTFHVNRSHDIIAHIHGLT